MSDLSFAGSTTIPLSGTASGFVNPAYINPGDATKIVTYNGVQTTCGSWTGTTCDAPKIMITDSAPFASDLFASHKNVWISPGDPSDFCYYASKGTDIATPTTNGTSSWTATVTIISVGFGGTRPSSTNGPFAQDLGSYIRYWSVIDMGVMNPPHHSQYPGPYTSNFGYALSYSDGKTFSPAKIDCAYW
ncbi:MAG: hypothetical protein RJB66_298 [Pseudomonadota bacterium]